MLVYVYKVNRCFDWAWMYHNKPSITWFLGKVNIWQLDSEISGLILGFRPASERCPCTPVANSCTNDIANDIACEWRRFFSLKMWGSYGVYLYAEPERFLIRWLFANQCESDTNWYDAVRCNEIQHDGDTMQYKAVRWWWRINFKTFILACELIRKWQRTNTK